MLVPLHIYVLTNNRDRETVNRFVTEYVDWDASYDRGSEQLYSTPLNRLFPNQYLPLNAYDRIPSINLFNVIELGLAYPRRDFHVFLKSKVHDIDQVIIGFTIDNCLVLGCAIESYNKHDAAMRDANFIFEKLVVEFDCILGLIAAEQGPPNSMERFRSLEGVGMPLYIWSKPA